MAPRYHFSVLALLLLSAATRVSSQYIGKRIGKLSELQHDVRGEVYAVDSRTIHVKGFSYDGNAPDAFFYGGFSGLPSDEGFIIPDENGSTKPLGRYRNKDVTLTLPEGITLKDVKWISVWCRAFAIDFGHLIVPSGLQYPRPQKINALSTLDHGVSSDRLVVVDAQTFLIPNFSYDGAAPDAHFWVGRGTKPGPDGTIVPDENGSSQPLKKYEGKTIVITLPDHLTVFDIDYLSVWCEDFFADFGHVRIPSTLNVPPSLKMLGVAPQSGSQRRGSIALNLLQDVQSSSHPLSPANREVTTFRPRKLPNVSSPTTVRPTTFSRPAFSVPTPQLTTVRTATVRPVPRPRIPSARRGQTEGLVPTTFRPRLVPSRKIPTPRPTRPRSRPVPSTTPRPRSRPVPSSTPRPQFRPAPSTTSRPRPRPTPRPRVPPRTALTTARPHIRTPSPIRPAVSVTGQSIVNHNDINGDGLVENEIIPSRNIARARNIQGRPSVRRPAVGRRTNSNEAKSISLNSGLGSASKRPTVPPPRSTAIGRPSAGLTRINLAQNNRKTNVRQDRRRNQNGGLNSSALNSKTENSINTNEENSNNALFISVPQLPVESNSNPDRTNPGVAGVNSFASNSTALLRAVNSLLPKAHNWDAHLKSRKEAHGEENWTSSNRIANELNEFSHVEQDTRQLTETKIPPTQNPHNIKILKFSPNFNSQKRLEKNFPSFPKFPEFPELIPFPSGQTGNTGKSLKGNSEGTGNDLVATHPGRSQGAFGYSVSSSYVMPPDKSGQIGQTFRINTGAARSSFTVYG